MPTTTPPGVDAGTPGGAEPGARVRRVRLPAAPQGERRAAAVEDRRREEVLLARPRREWRRGHGPPGRLRRPPVPAPGLAGHRRAGGPVLARVGFLRFSYTTPGRTRRSGWCSGCQAPTASVRDSTWDAAHSATSSSHRFG